MLAEEPRDVVGDGGVEVVEVTPDPDGDPPAEACLAGAHEAHEGDVMV